jgi:hypothetical protein
VARWRVCYRFSNPVDVQSPITAYPSLGVSLYYNESAKLVRIEHELVANDVDGPSNVIDKSQVELRLFWELMHYQRGVSLPINNRSAQKLDQGQEEAPVHTGIRSTLSRFSVCKAIVMPDDKVFKRTNNRLIVWLWLANMARQAIDTPKDNAEAIRNYYMIWEDLHGTPDKPTTPKEARELKLIRDLVSHGYKVNNKELRKLTLDQCGREINQFDPTDKTQQCLVHRYRTIGHDLIEAELDRMLK